ncbi:hypothetical protein AVR91_0239655 [Amycolatopsis keratiniphila subsp. keratiniphila]|uniref:Transcriptional regulator n=1 Tax=Amycolatopsis keratiniphila subsp. keratiniphila TaxID=227715 RepID=A0A1W2LHY4_9PSEU|nr:hypothetical protein AVR91_0239655 [Amycolatopsis keratiniphila subsp. keratiniphila]
MHPSAVRSRSERSDAAEALVAATRSLGLDVRLDHRAESDSSPDLLIELPDGRSVVVEAKTASLVTADSAPGQLRRWSDSVVSGTAPVVVAGRITAGGRDKLNQAGWSWLDLRGHLRLVGPGLFVDVDIPALSKPGPVREGVVGQVGIELATLLLLDPATGLGVREAAAELGRAASSVSEAFAALRTAGLVAANRAPAVPELFWELAEHWKPVSVDVASVPKPGGGRENSVLSLGFDDVESTVGWALTDTVAVARYGAPVSVRADHPPDFYVPDQGVLRRATRLLGTVEAPSARAASLRVAPTPLACARRVDGAAWAGESWPLANPLFVALDLARDPGRGREILDMWTPAEPWHRVW